MNALDTIAVKAVDRYFRPPNAARAARRQVFALAGTTALALAALQLSGPLSWLLWAWIAYRAFVFAMLVIVGPRVADELTRRLTALPPAVATALSGKASL